MTTEIAPVFGSWGFMILIYFLLGWFVTRFVEHKSGDVWPISAFAFCLVLWLPLIIIGFIQGMRD